MKLYISKKTIKNIYRVRRLSPVGFIFTGHFFILSQWNVDEVAMIGSGMKISQVSRFPSIFKHELRSTRARVNTLDRDTQLLTHLQMLNRDVSML